MIPRLCSGLRPWVCQTVRSTLRFHNQHNAHTKLACIPANHKRSAALPISPSYSRPQQAGFRESRQPGLHQENLQHPLTIHSAHPTAATTTTTTTSPTHAIPGPPSSHYLQVASRAGMGVRAADRHVLLGVQSPVQLLRWGARRVKLDGK